MHHFVLQTTPRDCGWACLKMILADLSHNEAYLTLANPSLKGPLSFLDLVTMATPYGVTLEGYKVTSKKEVFKTRGCFIALGETQGRSHYVIVDRVRGGHVLIRDPAFGSYPMEKEEFLRFFGGHFLVISQWQKPKECVEKPLTLSKKTRFFLYAWQGLSALALLAGLWSINREHHFVLPIALFATYFLLELCYKASLLKAMAFLDRAYIEPKMKTLTKDIRGGMRLLYEMKASLIATPLSFITHLMTVVALVIILGLNGWNNLVLIGFAGLLLFLERLFWVPRQSRQARTLSVMEENLVEGMSTKRLETDVDQGLKDLHRGTYRYAMEEEIRKYVVYFALLAGVLLSMALTGNVALDYLVFHFMALAFLSENLRAMMDYPKKLERMRHFINRYHTLK